MSKFERGWFLGFGIFLGACLLVLSFALGHSVAMSQECGEDGGTMIEGRCLKVVEIR